MTDRRPYEKPTLTALSEDELVALLDRTDLAAEPVPPSAQDSMREVVWLSSVLSVLRRRGGQARLMAKIHARIRTLEHNI
jgi:hypothetical protein